MATNPLIRIPRAYRRKLRHIAHRQAVAEAKPQIRAIKQQRRLINRSYHAQLAENRQAINLTHQALNQIPLKGLTGQYRAQVKADIGARNSMASQALAPLQAGVSDAHATDLLGVQSDLIQARADRATSAASIFGTLKGQERTYLTSQAQKRHQNQQERRQHRRQNRSEIRSAVEVGQQILGTSPTKGPGSVPWSEDAIKNFGSEEAAWEDFTLALNHQADVSERSARMAVKVIQRRLQGMVHGWATKDYWPMRPAARHPGGTRPGDPGY